MAIKLHDGSFSFGVTDISKMETTQTPIETTQTPVDFLAIQLPQIDWDDPFYAGILQEAKAMEKEQIKKAYIEGAEIAKEVLKEELKEFIVLPKNYISETYNKI